MGLGLRLRDKLVWTITGNGGHGANLANDTVAALAQLIQSNLHLVARKVDAQDAAVISIGQISAAAIHNVIPQEVVVGGTLRTQSPYTREAVIKALNPSRGRRCGSVRRARGPHRHGGDTRLHQ